jgi:translation elongation factor EF-1beta
MMVLEMLVETENRPGTSNEVEEVLGQVKEVVNCQLAEVRLPWSGSRAV